MKKALKRLNRPTVIISLGLFLSVIAVLLWLPGEVWLSPLQTFDTPAHLNYIREILDKGVLSAVDLKFEGGFYPPLFHLVAAMFSLILGGSVTAGATAAWLLGAAVIFPLGMVLLIQALIKTGYLKVKLPTNIVIFTTIILSLSFAVFPYLLLQIGTLYAYGFAMSLTPLVLASLLLFLRRFRFQDFGWLVLVLGLMGLAQPRALFSTVILALPLVFLEFRRLHQRDAKKFRRVSLILGLAVLSGFLATVIYVLTRLRMELLLHPENWFSSLNINQGWLLSVWQYLSVTAWQQPTDWLMATVVIGTLVINLVLWRKLKTGQFILLWVIFGVLFVLAASGDSAFSKILTAAWYKNPWRIGAALPVIIIPMMIMAVNWLAVKTKRIKLISIAFLALGLVLLIFNGQNWQIRKDLIGQTAMDNPYAMLSTQKTTAFHETKNLTETDALIVADPFTGATLDYALTGQELLFPIQNPRLENSADMQNMLAGWYNGDINQICSIRPAQPKYFLNLGTIYSDFDPIYQTYAVFHDEKLKQSFIKSGWLTEIKQFPSGQEKPFELYKINCK